MRVQTTAEAVIALIGSYYVFDLKYDDKVQNALLFMQSFVFGERDNATDSCAAVHSFSTLVGKIVQKNKKTSIVL